MAAQNRHNIANGILSFFVLVSGIAFSVLMGTMTKKLNLKERGDDDFHRSDDVSDRHDRNRHDFFDDDDNDEYIPHLRRHHPRHHHLYSACWTFGFAFILTGIVGIVSAVVKGKRTYITHMVFGIVTLVVKGALFVFAIFAFEALAILRTDDYNCESVGDHCKCRFQSYNFSCEDVSCIYKMLIGVLVVIVLGWILTLVTTILAGVLGCKKQTQEGVIVRSPMPTTFVQLAPGTEYPTKAGYLPPQTNDNVKLVSNMEVQPGLYSK